MKVCGAQVRPLLDAETVVRLQAEYLDNMRKNYSGWMRNTINAEMEDWKKSDDPEQDTERWQVLESHMAKGVEIDCIITPSGDLSKVVNCSRNR